MSERKCPICERHLKDIDFFDKNYEQYGLEQCALWWNKPNMKILCCNCFKKLNIIKNNKVENVIFKKCKGLLNHFSIIFENKSVCVLLSPKQYTNLKEWGLL